MNDDELDRAFAQLRDRQLRPTRSLPDGELDALCDARADEAERLRVAAAVVRSPAERERLARLLAVDAAIDDVVAHHRRRRFGWLAGAVLAAAAAVLLLVWFGRDRAPALTGTIEVADAEPSKDPAYPGYTRLAAGEALLLSAQPAVPVQWLAVDVATATSFVTGGRGDQPVRIERLLPLGARGVVLVAATRGDGVGLRPRLEALCDAELRTAAATGLAAAAAVLRQRVDRSTFGADTLVLLVEVF